MTVEKMRKTTAELEKVVPELAKLDEVTKAYVRGVIDGTAAATKSAKKGEEEENGKED